MDSITISTLFEKDVYKGLTSMPKNIPSKYLYDDKGSRLFQQIMQLDEYYPFRCELEIFNNQKQHFLEAFQKHTRYFHLIEFGAGDGAKTKVLLKHFQEQKAAFSYFPIDISGSAVKDIEEKLKREVPGLNVDGIHDEYFNALMRLNNYDDNAKKVIFFLGGNIGNFYDDNAIHFLRSLREYLKEDDLLVIGFDIKKDPQVIINAYDDASGVTRAFNFNLLDRINTELDGDFDMEKFMYYPVYDPENAEVRSYLISTESQQVNIKKLALKVDLEAWEPVHTEISRKYDESHINFLAEKAGFRVEANLYDESAYYADSVWCCV